MALNPEMNMITLEKMYDCEMRQIIIRMRRYVLEQEAERIICEYPADWWQAFRQRWRLLL